MNKEPLNSEDRYKPIFYFKNADQNYSSSYKSNAGVYVSESRWSISTFRIPKGFMIHKWLRVAGLEGLCILKGVKTVKEMR